MSGNGPPPTRALRTGALNLAKVTAIGMASTAPAYSVAATLAFIVASVGLAAPWILALASGPVVLTALSFRELNRAEPDCGTVYTWATLAFGPRLGWLTGWASLAACLLVMTSLAQVSSIYALRLFGLDELAVQTPLQVALGAIIVVAMTMLASRGITVAARIQTALVSIELAVLWMFVVIALLAPGGSTGADNTSTDWVGAVLVAIFVYWGWDSAFSLNEESTDQGRVPGVAALAINLFLLFTYVAVAYAALDLIGAHALATAGDDVFVVLAEKLPGGSTVSFLLVLTILVSAVASIQSTVIPSARTIFSMARHGAIPAQFARVGRVDLAPKRASWAFGAAAIVLYIFLALYSGNVLVDSVEATALLISLYYSATCFAVPVYFWKRRILRRSFQRFLIPCSTGLLFLAIGLYGAAGLGLDAFVAGCAMLFGLVIMIFIRPHPWSHT